jgi:hypothetical protein
MTHSPATLAAADRHPQLLTLTGEARITAESTEGATPRFTLDVYSGGLMYPTLSGELAGWNGPTIINIAGLTADAVVPVHRQHDTDTPVGHGSLKFGDRVTCEGVFSVDSEDSREILSSSKRGFPWKASIGLGMMRYEIVEPGQRVTVNGTEYEGPLLHVTAGTVNEVSFVTVPGDPAVNPAIAASQRRFGADQMNFEQWLDANGWNPATLSASQRATLQAAYDSEKEKDDDELEAAADDSVIEAEASAEDDAEEKVAAGAKASAARQLTASRRPVVDTSSAVAAARQAAAAEQERIDAIREIGDTIGNPQMEAGVSLVAHAIREGWTANQTALYATRNSRPRGPAIHSSAPTRQTSLDVLQAGILLRANHRIDAVLPQHHSVPAWMSRDVNDPNRQQIMEAAHRYRDCEMIEYIAHGLQAMGHQHSHGLGRSGRLATLQAGFSTGAVASIFTQSIGARALQTYMEAGDFTRGWTSEEDVPNLIETDRPRMQAGQDLTLHETGGEARHVYRSANNEKVKADRYSQQIEIDENDFINDRFSLLRETPVEFGRAAARLRPNMVAAVLLANEALSDNVALFHAADHKNLFTGSALSQPNLQKARAALEKQKDGDASINLQATHLIVPSDLGDLAIQLTRSAVISNDNGVGSTNPIALRDIMPVSESRLSNGVVDPKTGTTYAGSLTTWYLVSNEAHTIEVQFLEGTGRVPQIVVTQLTGGRFGLNITCKHFIGAKALDFRGMVRSAA